MEQSAIIFSELPLSVFCRADKVIFFELEVCKLCCPITDEAAINCMAFTSEDYDVLQMCFVKEMYLKEPDGGIKFLTQFLLRLTELGGHLFT